jgi:hypothetical protein
MNSLLFHSRHSTLLSMGSIFTCVIAIKSCQRYPPVFLLCLIITTMTHANYNIAGDASHNLTQKRSDMLDTTTEHDEEYALSDDDLETPAYSESHEFAYDNGFKITRTTHFSTTKIGSRTLNTSSLTVKES